MSTSKRFWHIGGSLAAFLVVVCIAIAVNVILGGFSLRKDLTEESIYTLSDGTRSILAKLDRPVTLKFYFSGSNAEVPQMFKTYGRRVEDLLGEYAAAAGGNLIVEKYDPKPDSDAEDWAQRYGVNGQSLGIGGPMVYIGLVAVCGDADAVLPVLDPRQESTLEYSITRMLTQITKPAKPVIAVMSSLPLMGSRAPSFAMPNQPRPAPAWFAIQDLRKDYDVREIDTAAESIDADVGTLLVIHPKNLTDATQFAIDQFVLRGGKLMLFVDPLCAAEAETQPPMQGMQFSRNSSDLPRLLQAWGVTYDAEKVVADLQAASMLRTGEGGRVEENPTWLSLRQANFTGNDVLTAQLESIMLPFAGSFAVSATPELEVTPLITSSEVACPVDAVTAQFSSEGVRRGFKSAMSRLNLAVRLHGKLKTAFPDGKPAGEPASTNATEAVEPPALTESAGKSTVLLIADADLMYDRFCVQAVNFFGVQAHQPINDNLAFVGSAVEQMAGSADLVSIRTRGKTDRPFEVVLAIRRQAEEQYLAEETRLQQRLEEAQQRVTELQSKRDDAQRFILSPQQKSEIENFQKQVLETKEQLKLVRRKLREDIERLGVKVKVFNILGMPMAVALAGIGHWFYRRRKTRT